MTQYICIAHTTSAYDCTVSKRLTQRLLRFTRSNPSWQVFSLTTEEQILTTETIQRLAHTGLFLPLFSPTLVEMEDETLKNILTYATTTRRKQKTAFLVPILCRPIDNITDGLPIVGKIQYLPRSGKPVNSFRDLDYAMIEIFEENSLGKKLYNLAEQEGLVDPFLTEEISADRITLLWEYCGSRSTQTVKHQLQQCQLFARSLVPYGTPDQMATWKFDQVMSNPNVTIVIEWTPKLLQTFPEYKKRAARCIQQFPERVLILQQGELESPLSLPEDHVIDATGLTDPTEIAALLLKAIKHVT